MVNGSLSRPLKRRLENFLEAQTGVSVGALVRLGRPVFELYELDADRLLITPHSCADADELARIISALETSRLCWAFFSLNIRSRRQSLPVLVEKLLGAEPASQEYDSLLILLDELEIRWNAMDRNQKFAAETEHGFPTMTFDDLLDHFCTVSTSNDIPAYEDATSCFGPEDLPLPDALALFARPLIDDVSLMQDADQLEEALSRAGEYWQLAQSSPLEYDALLCEIKQRYARSESQCRIIEREAADMVRRFYVLFPERSAESRF